MWLVAKWWGLSTWLYAVLKQRGIEYGSSLMANCNTCAASLTVNSTLGDLILKKGLQRVCELWKASSVKALQWVVCPVVGRIARTVALYGYCYFQKQHFENSAVGFRVFWCMMPCGLVKIQDWDFYHQGCQDLWHREIGYVFVEVPGLDPICTCIVSLPVSVSHTHTFPWSGLEWKMYLIDFCVKVYKFVQMPWEVWM